MICSRGSTGACCQPDAWELYASNPYGSSEPVDSRTIDAAVKAGLDPHDVDDLVEGEWGWEPHDDGYDVAVQRAVDQLAHGRRWWWPAWVIPGSSKTAGPPAPLDSSWTDAGYIDETSPSPLGRDFRGNKITGLFTPLGGHDLGWPPRRMR